MEADTFEELKTEIGDNHLDIEVDDWKFFQVRILNILLYHIVCQLKAIIWFLQYGFVVPEGPESRVEDFKDDENGKIQFNLVRPQEPPRGQPRKFRTDKTRQVQKVCHKYLTGEIETVSVLLWEVKPWGPI